MVGVARAYVRLHFGTLQEEYALSAHHAIVLDNTGNPPLAYRGGLTQVWMVRWLKFNLACMTCPLSFSSR